jgi:hypothetical protein
MRKKTLFLGMVMIVLLCCKTIKTYTTKHAEIVYTDTFIAPQGVDSAYFKKIKKYELIFLNDTICLFRHTFFCSDILAEYRVIEQKCKYTINDNMLIVNNLHSKHGKDWYIDIPIQESRKCHFLSKEGHNIMLGLGTLYYLYGQVPNITNDTLFYSKIEKNVIILNKYSKETNESVYCEFKK